MKSLQGNYSPDFCPPGNYPLIVPRGQLPLMKFPIGNHSLDFYSQGIFSWIIPIEQLALGNCPPLPCYEIPPEKSDKGLLPWAITLEKG